MQVVSQTAKWSVHSINNEEAALSTPIRAFLLLTIISVSPSLLIMMTSYTRIIIVLAFLAYSDWNTDSTAKSDFDWTGIVFDIFYYVADISADQ